VIENAQMCHSDCLVRCRGNPVIMRDKVPTSILFFSALNWNLLSGQDRFLPAETKYWLHDSLKKVQIATVQNLTVFASSSEHIIQHKKF